MNMKPMEILSMIEEATGTRMYESKKDSCTRAIEKKQLKYNELTKILNEDLHPQIEKLKGDRDSYMRYQQLTREIEHSQKFVIAFKYHSLDEKLQSADEAKARLEAELQSAREEDSRLKETQAQSEGKKGRSSVSFLTIFRVAEKDDGAKRGRGRLPNGGERS